MSTTELDTVKTNEQEPTVHEWRRPHYDVVEGEDAFEVKVNLPGFSRKEVDVSVDGDELKIVTSQKSDPTKDWRPLRQELPKGDFRLNLRLNAYIDNDAIKAQVDAGILHLTLPKAEAYKARKIAIN